MLYLYVRRLLVGLGLMWSCSSTFAEPAAPPVDEVTTRLEKKIADVRDEYSDVRHITPEVLDALQQPLLIDVRRDSEYAVSRIPGAVHAPDEERLLEVARQAGDRPIVVYCSLGVRSSIAVRKLQEQGYSNASNLDGSLFAWANGDRPLENDAGTTEKAHPFNAWWGRYLREALHAYEP